VVFFLVIAVLTGVRWTLNVVLICIYMVAKGCRTFSIYLLAVWTSFEKCLFKSCISDYAFFWCSLFLSSLYFLGVNSLLEEQLTKTVSHSVGCRFTLLIVSFAVQKLFN
jgi:hypothetical protein